MVKYIALKPEQVSILKPRGFHQKIEAMWNGYLLVDDVSFYLFCSLHLRPGQATVQSPFLGKYQDRYKCQPVTLNL